MLFYKIANEDLIGLEKGVLKTVNINGKCITLGWNEGMLFAFAEKCPHAGHKLSSGYIDSKGCVVCPLHGYRFSMRNGYNASGEGYKLKTFEVENRTDGWYVAL